MSTPTFIRSLKPLTPLALSFISALAIADIHADELGDHSLEIHQRRLHVGEVQIDSGFVKTQDGSGTDVRIQTSLASFDNTFGDAKTLYLQWTYLADQKGYRVHFGLEDSQVLFFCTTSNGTSLSFLKFMSDCKPSTFAVGGKVLDVQVDTNTSRWAVRWAELTGVINALQNGNDDSYQHKRLNFLGGASIDTIFPGNTTVTRLNAGMIGMIRSRDNHWELRGQFNYRPNVGNMADYAIEAKASAGYNFMMGPSAFATIAATSEYAHWSMPWHSIGDFTSDTATDTVYTGLLFDIKWQ